MSIFRRNQKNVNKGIKKIDAVITGLILGGIVASVYGIKKHENDKKEKEEIKIEDKNTDGKMKFGEILKALVFGFKKEEKKGFFSNFLTRLKGKK